MLQPKPNGEMAQAMRDLGIEYEDMFENRAEFVKRVQRKARELAAQLDRKTPLADMEHNFKAKALKNKDAAAEAEEIFTRILDLVVGKDPEVLVHLLNKIPTLQTMIENEVRGMAMRESQSQVLSKRHTHLLYMRLKKGFDSYVKFCDLIYSEKYAAIPAKSGNYSDDGVTGTKIYRIYVTGEEEIMFLNPWECAHYLGVEISFYLDLIEMIKENNGKIKDFVVHLEEVPR